LEAYELLERIRRLVERSVFCLPNHPLTITVSTGVTQLDLERHTSFEFVEEADNALYEAKNLGKNRVIIYGMGATAPTLSLDSPPDEPKHSA
jgi:diguanylate cyclase (GGDEF)-like protein